VSQIILAHRDEASGEIAYFSTIIRDLTDIVSMMDSLKQADVRKDEFIAMLAHELRNPLQAIQVALDLVESTGTDHLERATGIIGHQLGQLRRLVDDLMDVSRITRGKIALKRRLTDLNALVKEQFLDTDRFVDGEHTLLVEALEAPAWINADPARVEQIIGNLLTNACRYSDAGTEVRLVLTADDSEVRLNVIDQGVGLSQTDIDEIFEPFVQKAGMQHSGLGLGLTLIRKLMLLHGGSVAAFSDGHGKGSRFEVRFPLAAEAGATPEQPVEAGTEEVAGALKLDVLVVDDNVQALETLKSLLELRGCSVRSATCGADALALASEAAPDAAIIDIGLPDMSGNEVANAIRSLVDGSPVRLVAVTGFAQSEVRHEAMAAGFDTFLVKPVGLKALERALTG
ncbi:MAG: hybrid sensor histidine kinase/response regulator, partial [Pseudomonadota bacterium]